MAPRLGRAADRAAEAAVFKQLNINVVSCVPPFVQEAGREAYDNPESQGIVDGMVAEFQRRRDWIVPALNEIDGVRCQMPKGAFYVFPNVAGDVRVAWVFSMPIEAMSDGDVRARTSPSGMLQMFLLYRYGVATMDRNSFGSIGAEGQHFLRLSIATSMENCQEGVGRMAKARRARPRRASRASWRKNDSGTEDGRGQAAKGAAVAEQDVFVTRQIPESGMEILGE